jgi:hypothetical protein
LLTHDAYCIRRCSVARLLPATASRAATTAPIPGAPCVAAAPAEDNAGAGGQIGGGGGGGGSVDRSLEGVARDPAVEIPAALPRQGAARGGRAITGAAARRGSGVRFESRSSAEAAFSQFAKEAERMAGESAPGRLITDLVEFSSVSRQDVLDVLKQHLCKNLVQLGPKSFFLQTRGIPQGSILSSMLCCCVYAHLEHHRLRPVPSLHLHPPLSPAASSAISAAGPSAPTRAAPGNCRSRCRDKPATGRRAPTESSAAADSVHAMGSEVALGGTGGAEASMGDVRAAGCGAGGAVSGGFAQSREAGVEGEGDPGAVDSACRYADKDGARPRRKGKMPRLEASPLHLPEGAAPRARAGPAPPLPHLPSPLPPLVSPKAAVEAPSTAARPGGGGSGGGGVSSSNASTSGIQDSEASLLLRVVDDFLYISADLKVARAFVRAMACGHDDYGVEVNIDKSSVNFDVQARPECLPLNIQTSWHWSSALVQALTCRAS